ncbi:MAG: Yip1 family protein [Clostridia bacterium]|nr:Yip1 family protein [Clostridia bacterium]
MKKIAADLGYIRHVIFHPFDGFYEVRFRNKGNVGIALLMILISGLLSVLSAQYTGFIMNSNARYEFNSLTTFIFGVFPFFLFAVSNWSMTAIFDGSGKFSDIITVLGYSLFPKIIIDILVLILSNVVIESEVSILSSVSAIGTLWFAFLVFSGLCVIHEYGAGRNIIMLLATLVAAIVIVFLSVLYISLVEKLIGFVVEFASEFVKRW